MSGSSLLEKRILRKAGRAIHRFSMIDEGDRILVALSGGKDLSINVDYARYYARALYDSELHDQLLNDVMSAEPNQDGYTLFNTLAQREAQELLDAADEYF